MFGFTPSFTLDLSISYGARFGHGFDSINCMEKHEACETHVGGDWMSEEEIDYNLMGSFPASDPPSWTLGVRPHKTSCDEFEGEKPSPHDPSHQNEPAD